MRLDPGDVLHFLLFPLETWNMMRRAVAQEIWASETFTAEVKWPAEKEKLGGMNITNYDKLMTTSTAQTYSYISLNSLWPLSKQ